MEREGEKVPAWAVEAGGGNYDRAEELRRMGEGEGRSWNGTHAWEKTVLIISLEYVFPNPISLPQLTKS